MQFPQLMHHEKFKDYASKKIKTKISRKDINSGKKMA